MKQSIIRLLTFTMRRAIHIYLILLGVAAFAQEEPEMELGQSCETSIPLSFEDANFSIPEALGVIELDGNKSSISGFNKELNLTWYKFTAPDNVHIGFEIKPLQMGANLDFLLFQPTNKKVCAQIHSGQLTPLRKNLARAGDGEYPSTGLANGNAGLAFGNTVAAKKGQEFVLVVNNVHSSEGHQLRLKAYKTFIIKGKVVPSGDKFAEPAELFWYNIQMERVASSIKTDASGNFVLEAIVDDTDFRLEDYELIVVAKGYKLAQKALNLEEKKQVEVKLNLLVKDEITDSELEHLYFRPNSADKINDESRERLVRLLKELRFNPSLKVQLEGHSNGVYPSTEVDSKLSYTRAQSIKNYLIDKGIEQHRVFIKAYGSSKQLYPKAKNETEESRNRRVEVRYVEF